MKAVLGLMGSVFAIACAVFALSNRAMVDVRFDPLPAAVSAPLFLLVLGPFVLGLFLGLIGGRLSVPRRAPRPPSKAAPHRNAPPTSAGTP